MGLRPANRRGFTQLVGTEYAGALAAKLIYPVDRLRDLLTKFGLRPYVIHLVWTQWSEGARGRGVEEVVRDEPLLPTPKIAPLTSLDTTLFNVGQEEIGDVMLEQISARYTEDYLSGRGTAGEPIPDDQNFYYEAEFPDPNGQFPGVRRRFVVSAAPSRYAGGFQWKIILRKAIENRLRDGTPAW